MVNNDKPSSRLPHGYCPFCDSESGAPSAWGLSAAGWSQAKEQHDNGHPKASSSAEEIGAHSGNCCCTPRPSEWPQYCMSVPKCKECGCALKALGIRELKCPVCHEVSTPGAPKKRYQDLTDDEHRELAERVAKDANRMQREMMGASSGADKIAQPSKEGSLLPAPVGAPDVQGEMEKRLEFIAWHHQTTVDCGGWCAEDADKALTVYVPELLGYIRSLESKVKEQADVLEEAMGAIELCIPRLPIGTNIDGAASNALARINALSLLSK